MILLVHMLFGAAVGYTTYTISNNLWLTAMVALLAHYFLDFFPHIEYDIHMIVHRQWKKSFLEFFLVLLDFLLGITALFIFSKNHLVIFICALVTILPDALTLLTLIYPQKVLLWHHTLHGEKIQFLKYKTISKSWRLFTQYAAVVISLILLKG